MADKTYKMTVTLSDGSTIDAGTFVAPQGPKGDTGTIPEALPQEASALKSGNLPTSGWVADGPFWTGTQVVEAHKTVSLGTFTGAFDRFTPSTVVTLKNSTGKEYTLDNYTYQGSIKYYTYGDTYLRLQVHNTGKIELLNGFASTITVTELTATTFATHSLYTISDTSITANSDVLMELTDDGGVKSYSMEAGKITVIRDTVPTQAIPYTYKVKQTNASGQFTLVNHFVPSISESPTSLPVTYKKASGSLPTTGWGDSGEDILWEGQYEIPANTSGGHKILPAGSLDFDGLKANTETSDWLVLGSTLSTYSQPNRVFISDDGGIYLYFFSGARTPLFRITPDGSLECNSGGYSAQSFSGLKTTKGVLIYSISDNAITINSSVKMYLTDENIKPYNKVDGSIIVTRNVVPTQPIAYKYEVEQTSTEGLFEIINDYVPTKTSQLTNDSGFITAANIPSVGEWVTVTGTTANLTEAGTYQLWRDLGGQVLVYWDGQTESSCTLPCVSFLVSDQRPYIHKYGASITAGGVLSMTHESMTTDGTTNWTQSAVETESGFKYRKIN